MSGVTMTNQSRSAGGRGRTRSPLPCSIAVPPWRKKGTSEPRDAAISDSLSMPRPRSHRRSRARSVAAASLLPPPQPSRFRDALFKPYPHSPSGRVPFDERRRGLPYQVVFGPKTGNVALQAQGIGMPEDQRVVDANGLGDRYDIVVAVVTAPDDLQCQVELGVGPDGFHFPKNSGKATAGGTSPRTPWPTLPATESGAAWWGLCPLRTVSRRPGRTPAAAPASTCCESAFAVR